MHICLWKRTAPFHSTAVTCHNLPLLLWSPCQRCPLPSAIVPLQLFGDHTENQIQADFGAKKSLFLWGSAPAAVPAQLRRAGSDGAAAAQGASSLERTRVHMGCALSLPAGKTKGFLNRKLHVLAYSPAAECHVQKSQAIAVAVSWLGNYPARSGLSILCTFKF